MKKTTVGIRVLKDRLSAYVRKVATSGESIVITDRGQPVARLTGVGEGAPAPRPPMRIRLAVQDHSDLSFMKRRLPASERRLSGEDVARALDLTRGDATLP